MAVWATSIGISALVGDAIALLAGAVWCVLAAGYLRQGAHQILADLSDTASGPMLAAPIMSALVLGSVLSAHARMAGHGVVTVTNPEEPRRALRWPPPRLGESPGSPCWVRSAR